ncbi:glycosyltransferase [uncultured Desulfosarcina sp.]|uniref:glycosyltransferase n=1 Tax=uncultured Desulfosarcina sp. TaxID=218289 RepID=UPI0029C8A505|nr:glycosyltransferase [uncultured Desulfosarcina sp.]
MYKNRPPFNVSVISWQRVEKKSKRIGIWTESNNPNINYITYGINKDHPYLSSFLVSIKALFDKSDLIIIQTAGIALQLCILKKILRNNKKCVINAFILDSRWEKLISLVRWAFWNVDMFIVHSKSEACYYNRKFGLNKRKFAWIPLGIKFPQCSNDSNYLKEKYLFAGGKSHRDYETFIKTVTALNQHAIIISGNVDLKKAIKKNPKIISFGFVEGKIFWNFVKASKFVIVPLSEKNISCGQLVILGAMSLGKVVIVPKVKATIDYIDDGKTGFFYDFKDHNSLSNVIRYLDLNPLTVSQVETLAKQTVNLKYGSKEFVQKIEKVILSLLS